MKVRILKSICHPISGKPLGKGLECDLPDDYAKEYARAGIVEALEPPKSRKAVKKRKPSTRKAE